MSSYALFLFGSAARGDSDETSDIDVLAIYPSEVHDDRRRAVHAALINHFGRQVALAEYSRVRIAEMFHQGDLFAWHLFLEAQRLSVDGLAPDYCYSFPSPSPYTAGKEDALRFITLLRSVQESIVEGKTGSEVHEAGLIYLSLRNIAMSLSYSCCPRPDFTRHSPYNLSAVLGIQSPCEQELYDALIQARHSSQRGLPAPIIDLDGLEATVTKCRNWAESAMGKFYEKCKR
jgi:hypothetical protein